MSKRKEPPFLVGMMFIVFIMLGIILLPISIIYPIFTLTKDQAITILWIMGITALCGVGVSIAIFRTLRN